MATNTGQNVRAEMARRSKSQTYVATLLGLSQTAVSRRLSGDVDFSASELAMIADDFGTQVGTFFGEVAA